jgi:hypothetical protein
MTTTLSGSVQAVPDWRYAHEVQPNALAEMLGIGPRGLRSRQIAAVAVTAWLAGNAELLRLLAQETVSTSVRPWLSLWPVLFVFSAVTTVRTLGNGPAVPVCTAILYSLLAAAYQSAIVGDVSLGMMRQLASSAAWAALMMLALQSTVSRRPRWVRMVGAIFLADLAAAYLGTGLYSGAWDGAVFVETFLYPERAATTAATAIIWTVGFRIAESRYRYR